MVQKAADILNPGYYMARIDLTAAYHSVQVCPEHYPLVGLKWKFAGRVEPVYMIDTGYLLGLV